MITPGYETYQYKTYVPILDESHEFGEVGDLLQKLKGFESSNFSDLITTLQESFISRYLEDPDLHVVKCLYFEINRIITGF